MELEEFVTGIDLGSTKITAVIGARTEGGDIEVLGMGTCPSEGIKQGSIVNIDATANAIQDAVQEAELQSGFDCGSAIINITGKHIQGANSRGVIAISNRERIVGAEEVMRVVEAAQAVRMPPDQSIIHVLAREFIVDEQTSIKDPLGMTGIRLESNVHIVTASVTALHNLEKAVHKAGIRIEDRVLSSLASAEAVLTPGEQELGTALVDIGSGVIDIVVYFEGGVCYTSTIPLGGYYVTQDISIGLKTPIEAAEVLKIKYGVAMTSLVDPMESIEVPTVGDRPPRSMQRQELAQIIQPRMKEIFELIDQELIKSGKKNYLAGGVVLTGGGSLLEGSVPFAEAILNLSVSLGQLKNFTGLTDRITSVDYATAAGLLAYGIKNNAGGTSTRRMSAGRVPWTRKLKSWIEDNL